MGSRFCVEGMSPSLSCTQSPSSYLANRINSVGYSCRCPEPCDPESTTESQHSGPSGLRSHIPSYLGHRVSAYPMVSLVVSGSPHSFSFMWYVWLHTAGFCNLEPLLHSVPKPFYHPWSLRDPQEVAGQSLHSLSPPKGESGRNLFPLKPSHLQTAFSRCLRSTLVLKV